jgi:hypothetical protein
MAEYARFPRGVRPFKLRERTGVSSEGVRPAYEDGGRCVNRQRVARLIAWLALGIAAGAALAYLAIRYL